MMAVVDAALPADDPVAAAHRDHYRSLVGLACVLVDDRATCEEIVQDAFVAVFRRRDRVIDKSKLPAYLRSAVLNGARSHLRRRRVRDRARPLRVVEDATSPEHAALAGDEHRVVVEALRALPARQRDALVLRYYLDLSEREIAETLGVSPGTVKTHIRRGLEALASTLERDR